MADHRRQFGMFAVLSLVLLRLAIGWHFFDEGTDKLAYDSSTGQLRVDFSAAGFLAQAKGPLADLYLAMAPDAHGWSKLLALPRQNVPPTSEEFAHQTQWLVDYQQRRAEAVREKEPVPVEVPPFAPYYDWAQQIVDDWRATLEDVTAIPDLTDDQRRQAADAFVLRNQQLADFLAGEAEAIAEYQHELWRLDRWRTAPEADGLPFQEQRIATKAAETAATAKKWVGQVRDFEQNYLTDLRSVATPEQQADSVTAATLDDALTSPRQVRLDNVNLAATVVTVGVGICLLLGFFTRLASLCGALFLAGVIASQPPWVPGAESTMSQTIEFAGLLVLAGTGAGRWLGLDFFTYALFHRKSD